MKKIQSLVLALCVGAIVSGCGKKESADNSGSGNAAAPAKTLKLAFVSNTSANFWKFAHAGCNAAAQELGDVDVDFRITTTGTSAEQRQTLDDLVAKGVDGIAVSVNDPDNQTDFLNKIAGQTLLVCCDSDAAKSKRVAYIGTDNEAAGEQAGA
ncbi:MAG TPA: substrate-binding domain-containing protein, partial [Verrucomicrobiae bacterium]|nr:substrate-binding domain-containing protein [Verrucomicrobiae bacterium]